jgi:hypothetical protein
MGKVFESPTESIPKSKKWVGSWVSEEFELGEFSALERREERRDRMDSELVVGRWWWWRKGKGKFLTSEIRLTKRGNKGITLFSLQNVKSSDASNRKMNAFRFHYWILWPWFSYSLPASSRGESIGDSSPWSFLSPPKTHQSNPKRPLVTSAHHSPSLPSQLPFKAIQNLKYDIH